MAGLPDQLTLEVAVPERLLASETVKEVQIPAASGYLGVLPGHAPLMTELGTGVLAFKTASGSPPRYMAINGGIAEVLPDHIRVLADTAEWAEEIDVERARKARERASDLLQRHDMEIDVERAQRAVRRAQARLQAAERHKRS
jgi:F-type H+-transporting ATPase subunit epsilon